ncbi:chondroitin proteoglycan 2-like [Daphnia carinata]|uniref:chondroitin proteoglycan 2-like n=1 Tax=Daphnia carinata TaxID=120202 RepID=UPI0025808F32|nr:chondroitin proteoglycan 2-like [Daphnia carinata]
MESPSCTSMALVILVLFQVCLGQLVSAGLPFVRQERHFVKGAFTCPPQDGFYPVPNACTGTYYSCVDQVAYEMSCPGDSIFDPTVNRCVPPSQASCQEFHCPAPGGFYDIPGTCGSNYYSCVNDIAYLMTCPGTSVFDPAVGVCVPKEVASCSTTTTTPGVTMSTSSTIPNGPTTTIGPFTCPDPFGFYPTGIPCDDQFWRCSNAYAYLMTCPPTTIWNQAATVCDYPYTVPGCS